MRTDRFRLSIGAKLTLRYTLAVSVTLVAVGLFVYAQIVHRINREARLLLEVEARQLAAELQDQLQVAPFDRVIDWLRTRAQVLVRSADPELDLGIELVSESGERLLAAGSLERHGSSPVSRAVLEGRADRLLRAVNLGTGRPFLTMAVRIPGGALQVAIDTARYADNVRHVRDVFLLSVPLVLLGTALSGWVLARGSLRPIAQITRTARRISGANLDEEVPQSGSGDELDQLAATLNEMLRRIGDSLARMRRFNANAAHELRTPLAGISSEIEVTLERHRDAREYRQVLGDVLARVQGLAAAVEGMLRLARAEAGLDPGARRHIQLDPVLETVREFFAPVAEENDVELVCALSGSPEVLGDAPWLHQLFSNLVANALRHTPAGGRIEIRSCSVADGIEVSVSDTGPGIPADKLEQAFERFERIGSEPGDGGFGLGLPIAREIARAHGGSVRAESEPGRGARIIVSLPHPPVVST